MNRRLLCQGFAHRNAGISFTHIFPGVVRTPWFSKSDTMFNFLGPLFNLLAYPLSYSIADSGEFTLYSLIAGKGGAYWRGEKGDESDVRGKDGNSSVFIDCTIGLESSILASW